MIPLLLTIVSVLILVLSIIDYNKSIGLFLIYRILVPLDVLYIQGIQIGTNLLLLYFLLLFILRNLRQKPDFETLLPFLFLYVAQGFLIPFHTEQVPIIEQLTLFRVNVMSLILPFIIINIIKSDPKQYRFFFLCLTVSVLVAVVYGASLMLTIGENAYIDAIANISGTDVREFTFLDDFRFFGYLSSVFKDVGVYGTFLIVSFLFVYLQIRNTHHKIWLVTIILVVIGVLFCGSRSVLFAVLATYVFYLLIRGNFKLAFRLSLVSIVLALTVWLIFPDYLDFVMSITSDDVHGSSTSMRVEQFMGCFAELEKNPLFGNGYGWTSYYNGLYGNHPVMLSFESLLIQILCNNGLMGLLIWVIAIISVCFRIKKTFNYKFEERYVLLSMIAGFILYSMFTADYGGIVMVFYFYSIIMASSYVYKADAAMVMNK